MCAVSVLGSLRLKILLQESLVYTKNTSKLIVKQLLYYLQDNHKSKNSKLDYY